MTSLRPSTRERLDSRNEQDAASEALRVWLLGGFRVSVGSREIGESEWSLRKAASLAKLLALSPGHRLHREVVMDRLWPELGSRAAANNLRQTLHVLRRTLGSHPAGSGYVSLRDEEAALCPDGRLWVDVDAFEEAAAAARHSREPAAYRTAVEVYSGELLPGDRYEDWTEERRETLRENHLALLVELAVLHEGRGEYGRAIEALRRVVSEEPIREEAHAGLMRLYALSGRTRNALRQYVVARRDPSAEARRAAWSGEPVSTRRDPLGAVPAGPSGPEDHPPEEIPSAGPHNLPATRGSFVGRERDVVEVKRLLAMTGLLTLTGAGGSGKTRLALEVAGEFTSTYPDGVWLAELAGALGPVARAADGGLGARGARAAGPFTR